MKKINYIAAAILAASVSAAYAQTPPAPAAQGDASIDKNLATKPTNKGLQNADQRVETNEAKIAQKRADRKEHRREERNEAKKRHEQRERVERQERVERPERPDRPERPGR